MKQPALHFAALVEGDEVSLELFKLLIRHGANYKFKDHNVQIQNYVNRVFALPQFIVYRRSSRFHERPYNGLGALYK